MNNYLDISKEVKEALDAGKPVVALESTIISHGMPYPQNVETALAVSQSRSACFCSGTPLPLSTPAPDCTQPLTSARDPMPCTFSGTLHLQLSLLCPEPEPVPSSSQHSTAQRETHRLPPCSAAPGTLPVALQSKTASNSAEIILSSAHFRGGFVPVTPL